MTQVLLPALTDLHSRVLNVQVESYTHLQYTIEPWACVAYCRIFPDVAQHLLAN
jgi:hypothetical protein